MGSDMCRRHLQQLIELLARFEREPKEIKGRKVTQWFRTGEDIFRELFKVGLSVEWRFTEIKNYREVSDICSQVTNNKTWLECFISLYPNFRIDLDLVGSADDICKVRSGIDVLLKGFSGITDNFDKVLIHLTEQGEVDEFDRCLKLWVETGHRPDFEKRPSGSLKDHWWWF